MIKASLDTNDQSIDQLRKALKYIVNYGRPDERPTTIELLTSGFTNSCQSQDWAGVDNDHAASRVQPTQRNDLPSQGVGVLWLIEGQIERAAVGAGAKMLARKLGRLDITRPDLHRSKGKPS